MSASDGSSEVVQALCPTALIGTSGEPDTFPESVIREMARHTQRPIVLPLSNPTSQCEAKPEDVIRWTNGRALEPRYPELVPA